MLVVEDELLVALDLCETLDRLGYTSMGPVANIADALTMIDGKPPDIALLDENLAGEPITAVAEALDSRHIPFAIVSGYGTSRSEDPVLTQARRIPKPATFSEIREAVATLRGYASRFRK